MIRLHDGLFIIDITFPYKLQQHLFGQVFLTPIVYRRFSFGREGADGLVSGLKLNIAAVKRFTVDTEVEHQAVKAFKKIKKKMTFEAIMKCGIFILILFAFYGLWDGIIEERVSVIPPSEIEVTEIYQLKNGDYYATLECEGSFAWNNCEVVYLPEDGNRFTSEEFCYELNFQRPFFWEQNKEFYKDKISIHFPKENYAFGKAYPTKECVSIQYISASGEEELIIWEVGRAVEAAPEEIEQRVDAQIDLYSP